MQQLQNLYKHILAEGTFKEDRTGVGCWSVFGYQMRFNLQDGFPLPTFRDVPLKPMVRELLWFLKGSTNNNELDAKIWDQWATEDGRLGPIYGKQWTGWEHYDLTKANETIESLIEELESSINPMDSAYLHKKLRDLQMQLEPRQINQIKGIIEELRTNPGSRRIVVTAWNPGVLPVSQEWEYENMAGMESLPQACGWEVMTEDQRADWLWDHKRIGNGVFDEDYLDTYGAPTHRRMAKVSPQENVERGKQALPPCHTMFQFYARELAIEERQGLAKEKGFPVAEDPQGGFAGTLAVLETLKIPTHGLSCQLYQRSADTPLGSCFNIPSYALLTEMVAWEVGMMPDEFIYTLGDAHIYKNQLEGVKEVLGREERPLPKLHLNNHKDSIFDFTENDIHIEGYDPHPKVVFPVAT